MIVSLYDDVTFRGVGSNLLLEWCCCICSCLCQSGRLGWTSTELSIAIRGHVKTSCAPTVFLLAFTGSTHTHTCTACLVSINQSLNDLLTNTCINRHSSSKQFQAARTPLSTKTLMQSRKTQLPNKKKAK